MSGTVDFNNPEANMFGVLPCPKCGSIFRWPTQRLTIQCDDCGFVEPLKGEQP
jgi:predicted RNA-binding Zn-ribbon protein involved in translation (DUF1610 family)